MERISNEIEQIVNLIKSRKIKIFCGAGISYNSGVPLVEPLVTKILEAFGATKDEIDLFKQAKYPFEAFINAIGYNYQGQVEINITELINRLFEIGSPNSNHYFISNLYKEELVDKVVTTNFDCNIEKALSSHTQYKSFRNESEFPQIEWNTFDNTIIKIHGCISEPQSIRTTLAEVSSHALHPERKDVIQKTFHTGCHEAVLVLGYSFSDHFDITPFLKEINSGKKLFIIQHSFDKPSVEDIPQVFPQISGFEGKVIYVDTDLLIKILWGKVLDTPYNDNLNSNCKLALKDWEVIIENIKEVLLKNEGYRIYTLGHLFQEIQQTKTASKYYKLLENSKYPDLYRGKALIGLCNVYRTEGKVEYTLRLAEEALKISIKLGDNSGKIASHTHLGIYHKRVAIDYLKIDRNVKKGFEHLDKALNHHNAAIEIISNATEFALHTKSYELVHQYSHIGSIYFWKACFNPSLFEESFKFLDKAEDLAKILGQEQALAHILRDKGQNFKTMAEIDNNAQFKDFAMEYFSQSLEKARALTIPTLMIDNLIEIARLVGAEQNREILLEAKDIAYAIDNELYIHKVSKYLGE